MHAGVQGKLIAGINSRVQIYEWGSQKDGSRGLVAGAGQSGLVLALYLACRGDFIVVGMSLIFSPNMLSCQSIQLLCCVQSNVLGCHAVLTHTTETCHGWQIMFCLFQVLQAASASCCNALQLCLLACMSDCNVIPFQQVIAVSSIKPSHLASLCTPRQCKS